MLVCPSDIRHVRYYVRGVMVGEEFWVKMGLNVVVIGVMKGVRRWMARRGGGELSRGEGNFNALQIIDK